MKIGILGCFYNCADLLPEVLAPWIALKENGHPVVLAGINVQFTEYAQLGVKDTDDATRAVLDSYRGKFDYLEFGTTPMKDGEARTKLLQYLAGQGVDLVWIVDGDEIYTPQEIQNILAYVEKTPQFDFYHVYLDNILFDRVHFGMDFIPPRVFRTDRHGGVSHFIFENDLAFKDGTEIYKSVPGIVPKKLAFIRHITWPLKDAIGKIQYQRQRFGYCPHTFDEKTGEIGVDPAYYALHKIPAPTMEADRLVWPPRPKVEVALILDDRDEESTRESLVKVLSALLVLERQNETDQKLTVFNPYPGRQDNIQRFLDLMPFKVALTNIAGEVPKDDSVHHMHPSYLKQVTLAELCDYFNRRKTQTA